MDGPDHPLPKPPRLCSTMCHGRGLSVLGIRFLFTHKSIYHRSDRYIHKCLKKNKTKSKLKGKNTRWPT